MHMRIKQLLFLVFIFFLLITFIGVYANYTKTDDLDLLGKVIYIDPGHGGRDSGTTYNGILEKDLNLQISLILSEELGKRGAIIYMTRTDDSDLSSIYDKYKKRGDLYRRIRLISNKDVDCDVYLSIHINWYDNPYWGGAEILYNSVNSKNKLLGEVILKHLKQDTGTKRALKKTDLYMYRNLNIPGVLIECGFLSNYRDRTNLQNKNYQLKLANSIADAVVEYFSI